MAERSTSGWNYAGISRADQLLQRAGGMPANANEVVDSRLVVLEEAISQNAASAEQLAGSFDAHNEALNANTRALTQSSARQANSGGASTVKSIAGTILGGMTLSPILRGLFSLFGGGSGSDKAPPPLVTYAVPPAVSVEGGVMPGSTGAVAVDRNDMGQVRPIQTAQTAPQITVNVQALDSRSILDRSDEIALAVRRAMLQSSSLNDVVSEL